LPLLIFNEWVILVSGYICPVCRGKFEKREKNLICENGHNFDISKQGYVNLLLSKGQGNHGDNKEMVRARKNFLEKGYYEKLRNDLSQLCEKYVASSATVLDAGCGECWYTAEVYERLKKSGKAVKFLAVDISKDALSYGAKRNKEIECAVASVFNLPIEDEGCDCLISVFSPYCENEYKRVLKKGGIFIMTIPGEEHLIDLKNLIYDEPYENEVKDYELDGFEFVESKTTDYTVHIDNNEDVNNLFMMTPYYYKTGVKEQSRVKLCEKIDTRVSFQTLVYKKI